MNPAVETQLTEQSEFIEDNRVSTKFTLPL